MKFKSAVVCALLLGVSAVSWGANDGATLYKKKCASCHGASGEGKSGPALKGTQLDQDQIVQQITKGKPDSKPPHKKGLSGISEEHAKAIAEYIKALQ
ncbi:MAG TPA: cytochrome c [Terriglobales bacterium]|nr:cytochrome c [Terriglobales bacterium]